MKKKLLALSGLLLAVLLGSELFARLLLTPPLLLPFVAHDQLLGHKGPPGGKVQTWNNRLEYSFDGFRLLPRGPRAKPGLEIAFLGDSLVEAISIADRDHFASVLENDTGAHGLLYAAGDWGTAQEALAFREYGVKAKPRAVVLAFSSLTDFANNGIHLANRYQSKVDDLRPYAAWNAGATSFIYRSPLYRFWRQASRLYLLYDNARIARSLARPVPVSADCKANANSVPLQVYFSDPDPAWDDAVAATALSLTEFAKHATAAGSKAIAIYVPNDFELLDDKWEDSVKGPAEFCFPGSPLSRQEDERKFLHAAAKAGLDAVSFYGPLLKEQKKTNLFLEDGHFNEHGHKIFSRLLAAELRRRKLVD